jgi:hypothetical protein
MQFVASIGLVVIGLALALVMHTSTDMRVFGWVLAGIGVFGLLVRRVLATRRAQRRPPDR